MNIYLKNFIEETFKRPGAAMDFGAGDFFDVSCLKQLGWKCEGVDKSTGVDLEKPFFSSAGSFDLVYSNYVIHKLTNKKQFVQTLFNNLKNNGWFFIHTFDKTDRNSKSGLSQGVLRRLLAAQGFRNIKTRVFSYYDNEENHKHWHRILEATGQK